MTSRWENWSAYRRILRACDGTPRKGATLDRHGLHGTPSYKEALAARQAACRTFLAGGPAPAYVRK